MKNSPLRLIRLLIVIALFAGMLFHAVPRASAAPIVVDDFNLVTDTLVLGVTLGTSPQYGVTDGPSTSILGGERDVEGIVAAGSGTMSINASDSSGFFSHSQPVGLRGQSIITWDGNDNDATLLSATGLNGIDLTSTGNDTFIVGSVSNDLATQVEVRVYTNASDWSFQVVNIPASSFELAVPFPFSGFATGGGNGADLASVGAIQLIVNRAATTFALDMVIDFFTVTRTTDYLDFGDAPDTYGTVSNSNGPRHALGNLILGSVSDGEADGNASPLADGDDTTNLPDEDGVVRTGSTWANGTNGGHLQVTVTGASSACLSAWMDFGQDGNFTQPTDQIFNLIPVVAGVNNLDFDIPLGTFTTSPGPILNARFRVVPDVFEIGICGGPNSPEIAPSYTGPYVNGEVEDYQWSFTPTAIELASLKAQSTTSPVVPVALIGVSAAVLLSVAFLTRRGRRKAA